MQTLQGLDLPGFDGRSFRAGRERFTFRRTDAGYFVDVSVDAELQEAAATTYPVRYVFGVSPLQQLLLDVGRGHLQALSVAWDTRPREAGGQRWFDLHPGVQVPPGDALLWKGPQFTWNFMCADCHSTGVAKNYDPQTQSYATTYAEVDVACEACHGPGAEHAKAVQAGRPSASAPGFRSLVRPEGRRWLLPDGAPIAHLEQDGQTAPAIAKSAELESCAPCHSRRSDLGPAPAAPDQSYHDRYRLALLDDGLYFADGQSDDEVFVHGSFLESRMHRAGVTCSDCHEPHSQKLRAEGNALCGQCHRPEVFDTPAHHFHPADSAGAACVSCHMPARTYMVLDDRRDHRFGLPQPGIAQTLQAPDACTGCHAKQGQVWAAEQIRKHRTPRAAAGFGVALRAGRAQLPGAHEALLAVLGDAQQPAIARATALEELGRSLDRRLIAAMNEAADDADPLLRRAAASVSAAVPARARESTLLKLLADPVRSVRVEAAGVLVGEDPSQLSDPTRRAFAAALVEYVAAQRYVADRADGLSALAAVQAASGDAPGAEALLKQALTRDPTFSAAYVNLSDLYRATGREGDAAALLEKGLAMAADRAALHHALGLSHVRSHRAPDGVKELAEAHRLAPNVIRYAYVYAVALHDTGQQRLALDVLRKALEKAPANPEVLGVLVDYCMEAGARAEAADYSSRLAALRVPPAPPAGG